jgi:hypothetical protein
VHITTVEVVVQLYSFSEALEESSTRWRMGITKKWQQQKGPCVASKWDEAVVLGCELSPSLRENSALAATPRSSTSATRSSIAQPLF